MFQTSHFGHTAFTFLWLQKDLNFWGESMCVWTSSAKQQSERMQEWLDLLWPWRSIGDRDETSNGGSNSSVLRNDWRSREGETTAVPDQIARACRWKSPERSLWRGGSLTDAKCVSPVAGVCLLIVNIKNCPPLLCGWLLQNNFLCFR